MDSRSGEMQVFTAVVDCGGFSAAAKVLNLTPSAVSKLITRIEQRLGVQLFQRSTRQMLITPEGQQFYDSCVRILQDIDAAEQALGQGADVPQGLLRVNVSVPFGTHQILPLLAEFNGRYPQIVLDLSLTDSLVDMQRERIDVAVRIGPLADASYRARLLGRSRRAVVASPQYLAAFGRPRVPADLARHRCLNFNFRRSLDEWPFRVDGQVIHLPVQGGMLTNNGETMRQLTIAGMGISRLGLFHVAEDLRAGRLQEVLGEFNPGDKEELHALFANQRHMPPRVRAFIDFLLERVSPSLRD